MNRKIPFHELAAILAGNCNITPAEAEGFIKNFFDLLTQTLTDGETVKIKGIGTFAPTGDRDNPVTFTPDVEIADSINAPFAMFEPEEVSDTLSDEALNELETPTPLAEQEAEQMKEPEQTQEPEPIAEPKSEPESQPEPESNPEPKPESEPQPMPVSSPQPDSSESTDDTDDTEHSDSSESPTPKQKATILLPEEDDEPGEDDEIEEYISETEKKSGAGFGWGFIIGMLVGLALGACGVYFAIDYIFPTTPTEYNMQTEEEDQPLAEIGTLDSIATPLTKDDSVAASAIPVANPDTAKAATPTPAEPTPAPAPTIIKDTVRPGYLLNDMAKKHYGNKCFWVYIYEENKAKIANPNRVGPGLVLVIPPAEKYGIDSSSRASIKAANEKAGKILSKYPK